MSINADAAAWILYFRETGSFGLVVDLANGDTVHVDFTGDAVRQLAKAARNAAAATRRWDAQCGRERTA
jgi:hypothetical protein